MWVAQPGPMTIQRIVVCEAQVPFVRGGAEYLVRSLVTALRERGYDTELISLPFKWYPTDELLAHAAAWHLIDLSESNGRSIDLVIASKFPTYFVRHPRKVVWLLHQYRAAYELCGTDYSEFTHTEADVALRETLIAPFSSGTGHLQAPFGEWFPISVVILAALGIAWTLSSALAPWRYELQQAAVERARARSLVTAWGADTLAPFALRADKSYFFSVEENAFLAYRVVGGIAIVSGDPIGAPEALEPLVTRFLEYARARGWKVAVLGASEETLPLYRGLGLTAIYHGDEAVLDVERFSLEGRRIRKVRQSVHRLRREGYTVRFATPAEIPAVMRGELDGIAESWRAGEPQKGFVMALDALFGSEGDDALFASPGALSPTLFTASVTMKTK